MSLLNQAADAVRPHQANEGEPSGDGEICRQRDVHAIGREDDQLADECDAKADEDVDDGFYQGSFAGLGHAGTPFSALRERRRTDRS